MFLFIRHYPIVTDVSDLEIFMESFNKLDIKEVATEYIGGQMKSFSGSSFANDKTRKEIEYYIVRKVQEIF